MISPIFPCLVVRPSVHMVTSLLLQFHIVLPSPQTTQPHPLIEMVDSGHLVMNMVVVDMDMVDMDMVDIFRV